MQSLIINLLDMAKLQSGKINLQREWQPIDEVIGSAARLCKPITQHHKIDIEIAPNLPLIHFDAVLIERVLVNLIDNAVKYGRNQIHISAAVMQQHLNVTVTDNGMGIPLGMEDKFFDKFMRGQKESATHGVGLGLAICKAIIEAHQGNIWASNLANQSGAKIQFTLPLGNAPSTIEELK